MNYCAAEMTRASGDTIKMISPSMSCDRLLCSLYPVFTAVACVAPVAADTPGHAGALLYLATLYMCQEDLLEFRYLMADSLQ